MRRNNDNGFKKQEENKLVITAKYNVKRSEELLVFLLEKCNTSRNNVKNLLSNKQILVNGSLVTQFNYLLGREDVVEISKYPVSDKTKKPKKKNEGRIPRIEIIYEDNNFIAINKPQGLLSVESDNERTCAFMYVSEYLKAQDKLARPYVIHRIDKETSGVLVFAKNPKIHSILRLNWNDYVGKREYHAVVVGKPPMKSDTIKSYLRENTNNLVYEAPTGDLAITHYELKKTNNKYSLLRVLIDTGRKNQIRVQMKGLGCPVVGDTKYGTEENPLKRLGLHASYLEITNPLNNEVMRFEAKVPSIFNGLFTKGDK